MRIFLFVLLATILEATGDAVVRQAIHARSMPTRIGLFLVGAAALALYGTSLNLAPIEFAQVTGLYIAILFVVFQIANYLFFGVLPTGPVFVGGSLVVAGGLVVAFWH